MKRVLVIGAGRRVVGAVLPALACLEDRFELTGIVARSRKQVAHGRRTITTEESLDAVEISSVDLIVLAVDMQQTASVIAKLARHQVDRTVLLVDTPVLGPAGLWAARYFPSFRRVVVGEDNLALPPFLLARQLVEAGDIGELRQIYFFHNGFKGHALASLKLLAQSRILRIVDRRFAGKIRQKEIAFENGVTAVMYEPRDYKVGKFLLVGDRGAIADYDYAVSPCRRLGYRVEDSVYRGLTLDGAHVEPNDLDRSYLDHISPDVPDASLMSTMKIRGLMDVMMGALDEHSRFHYPPESGVADYLAIRIVDRIGYLPAPHRIEKIVPLSRWLPQKRI